MKRPTMHNDFVIKAAATDLAAQLLERQIEDDRCRAAQPDLLDGLPPETPPLSTPMQETVDRYVADLIKHLPGATDGYVLARALDSYAGWQPDADMVEVLNHAFDELRTAEFRAVLAWVRLTNVTPVFEVGERVILDQLRLGNGERLLDVEMDVMQVEADVARYRLRPVRPPASWSSGWLIVPYERVRRPYCFSCGWANPGGVCRPSRFDPDELAAALDALGFTADR